jgi:sensor histidine kinase YesM
MALRMGSRMRFEVELPEGLQSFAIPPMLLQPLVENAIKHGIEPKIGSAEIRVQARRKGDSVEITVADTGLGLNGHEADAPVDRSVGSLDAAMNGTSSGYGLVHVRERLHAFYGASASLVLARNEPHGVRATVSIPR